jgi:hypothetical protein
MKAHIQEYMLIFRDLQKTKVGQIILMYKIKILVPSLMCEALSLFQYSACEYEQLPQELLYEQYHIQHVV